MDEPVVDDAALLKSKPKREKSDKQKEVWAKAQQTRLENAQLKKDALAKAKEDIDNKKKKKVVIEPDEPEPVVLAKPKEKEQPKPKPKVVYESDSEPEVVVIKKKKKKHIAIFNQRNQPKYTLMINYVSKKKNRVPVEEGRGGRGGNTLRGGT